jgi:hypothetical protein
MKKDFDVRLPGLEFNETYDWAVIRPEKPRVYKVQFLTDL